MILYNLFSGLSLFFLLNSAMVFAQEDAIQTKINSYQDSILRGQAEYQSDYVDQRINEQQNKIMQEAVVALKNTHEALRALDENNAEKAVAELESATGKLEITLAREPKLALAPTSIAVIVQDLYATPEMVNGMVSQVLTLISHNEIQKARFLIGNLGSDVTIRVSNIPLSTYPQAIKLAVKSIDQGELDKAKLTLKAALATQVITTEVIPLPYIRSERLLTAMEAYSSGQEDGMKQDAKNKRLATASMIKAIREELRFAETLGYAKKYEHKPVYKALDNIEKKNKMDKLFKDELDEAKRNLFKLMGKSI